MPWNDGLAGAALNIAGTEASPLRVMAGPGTGKSFVLKRRVARLLEQGADADRILAVTFTRNAARALVDDLRALDVPGCEDIRAGTLHSFCFSLLRHEAVLAFLGRSARPLVTFSTYAVLRFEAAPMLEDIGRAGAFGGVRECTTRIRAFEAAWARLQSEHPGWPQDAVDNQFHGALIAWLTFHQAMLVGELVPEALRYLKTNPAAPFRSAYDHVIVDEYQDLNRAEQDLIDLLADAAQVVVVGDVDQSVYSFRHANPEGIVEYAARHADTHDEELIECRRCPTRVVTIADHLIRRNHLGTLDARLSPFGENPDGEVHVVQWNTIAEEADGVAAFVSHLVANRGHNPGDILVLSPRRVIGYAIRDALRDADVPVHSFYHEEALEPEQAQEAMSLLTLLCDRDDRVALRWWLGNGSNSWRARQYEQLRAYCEEHDCSPRHCLQELRQGELTIPWTNQLVERYAELCDRVDGLADLDCNRLVEELLPDDATWAIPLRQAATLAIGDESQPRDLLDALRISITQPEMPEEGNFVRVMSLHKSKGLTSNTVIVAGCIEGLTPLIDRSLSPAEQSRSLFEQRRLFYVAVTRCREILVLSSVTSLEPAMAHRIGATTRAGGRTIASRFLTELGPCCPTAMAGTHWVRQAFAAIVLIAQLPMIG